MDLSEPQLQTSVNEDLCVYPNICNVMGDVVRGSELVVLLNVEDHNAFNILLLIFFHSSALFIHNIAFDFNTYMQLKKVNTLFITSIARRVTLKHKFLL